MRISSEEPLRVAGHPLRDVGWVEAVAPSAAANIAKSRHGSSNRASSVSPETFPAVNFTLQSECLFTLFTQLSLGPAHKEVLFRVALLEFFDVCKKALNLVTSLVDFVIQLVVHLISSLDLRLEVFDGAINITQRTLLCMVPVVLFFQMGLQLFSMNLLESDYEG